MTGVETGLVPHRSATTADARAEEARLLHVACTRAADRLVITRAARRGGYSASALSPLLVGLDASAPPTVAPPADVRMALAARGSGVVAGRQARPTRGASGRRGPPTLLPDQLCTDDDLARLAAHAAGRRRRAVVVDRARAADRGARSSRR